MNRIIRSAVWIAAGIAAPVIAAPADDVANEIINQPQPSAFSVYGLKTPPVLRSDPGVQGGKALRIVIPGASPNVWTIGLIDPIVKPVKKGDKLLLAFYARAETPPPGAKTVTLPNNSVQMAAAPYTGVFGGSVTIGPDWTLQKLGGVADRDYAAGELNVQLQLASGAQTIDIGPIAVIDLGGGGPN